MSRMSYTAPAPQRLSTMRQRIQTLYRTAGEAVHHDRLLSTAFEELAAALDTLHAAENERVSQFDLWLNERTALQAEIQRYQELFTEAPIGYLVTSADGTIRMANAAAARMLRASERRLLGRSLSLFIPDGQRRSFRTNLATLAQHEQPHEWQLNMQALDETPFEVESIVAAVRSSDGQVLGLRWLLHDITQRTSQGTAPAAVPTATRVLAAPALFQAECAFFADASVAVALASDRAALLAQIAQLAVRSVADVCRIDIGHAAGRRCLVCAATPSEVGREVVSHWLADTGAAQARWPQVVTVYSQAEVETLVAEQFADESATATLGSFRSLLLARAISAPLELGQQQGRLTLFSANPAAWQAAASSSLFAELARRMALAMQRAS